MSVAARLRTTLRWRDGLAPAILLGAFAAALFIARAAIDSQRVMFSEDAFTNAAAAKNMALGHGWYRLAPSPLPFHSHLTTGPTVLLPVTLAFMLFGVSLPVMGASTVLVGIVLVLGLGFWLTMRARTPFTGPLVVAGAVLLFSLPSLWSDLVGEPAAAILFAGGVVGLFLGKTPGERDAGAFFLSASALTKMIMCLGIPPVLLFFAFTHRNARNRRALFVRVAAVCLAPLLLWVAMALLSQGRSLLEYWKTTSYFLTHSSGIQEGYVTIPSLPRNNRWLSLRKALAVILGGRILSWQATGVLVITIFILLYRDRGSAQRSAAIALLLGGAAPLLFWLFIDPFGWFRRVIPAVMCLSMAALLAADDLFSPPTSRRWALLWLALIVGPRLPLGLNWRKWPTTVDPRRSALEHAVAALRDIKRNSPSSRVWASGWFYRGDMALFQTEFAPFQSCFGEESAVVAPNDIWISEERRPRSCDSLARVCERHPLFRDGPYLISLCDGQTQEPQ
jgi:hypothetical protein